MRKKKRRIVVGDIHGELDGFREILTDAKLIDDKDNWLGGNTVLIQTGDVIDRGLHSREAMNLLRRLQKQARVSKGAIVRLCGNHELMLLQGDYRYTNFNDPKSLAQELKAEIAAGDVLASYTDGERLYTHAGLRSMIREFLLEEIEAERPSLNKKKAPLSILSNHINRIFRESADNNMHGHHPIFDVGPDRGGGDPVGGIFWCDLLSISRSWEAWRISQIFGHTPTGENNVISTRGLRLIDVDAGMSRFYGGQRVYLEITSEGDLIQHSSSESEWKAILLGKSSRQDVPKNMQDHEMLFELLSR